MQRLLARPSVKTTETLWKALGYVGFFIALLLYCLAFVGMFGISS